MDEDNNDVPRVTRARTRRLSTLDTDNRPSTPHLVDATIERASPRPLRRTRLNSTTIEIRTPTRSTRLSVARGETPEPSTPVNVSSVKRATRTPAKSARKQLPLKEEEVVEAPMDVVNEVAELDSTPKNSPQSSDDRRVTRSMSKTPPSVKLSINSSLQLQSDTNNSEEKKQNQEKQTNDVISQSVPQQGIPHFGVEEQSAKSAESNQKSESVGNAKLQIKIKKISVETSLAETKTPKSIENETSGEIVISKVEKPSTLVTEKSKDTSEFEEHNVNTVESNQADGDVSIDTKNVVPLPSEVDHNPIVEERSSSTKKVLFHDKNTEESAAKPKYPKTPARINTPPVDYYNLTAESKKDVSVNIDTPIKATILKKRNSSTPLAKSNVLLVETSELNKSITNAAPPLQIDTIKPRSPSEMVAAEVVVEQDKPSRCLLSEEESEEDREEQDDEEDNQQGVCEFVDNEVEVVENYESGDSMDSAERREIEENEIPHDGESVGSQDTNDECSEDSNDEELSFIVSDNEEEDNQEGIEALCFSSASLSMNPSTFTARLLRNVDGSLSMIAIVMKKSLSRTIRKKQKPASDSSDYTKQILSRFTEKSSENKPKTAENVSLHDYSQDKDLQYISNEEDQVEARDLDKSCHFNSVSVCEVLDSSEEIGEVDKGNVAEECKLASKIEKSSQKLVKHTPVKSKSMVEEEHPNVMKNKKPSEDGADETPNAELLKKTVNSIDNENPTPMEQNLIHKDKDDTPEAVIKKMKLNCKSSAFHSKQNYEDEAVLLAGLSSCDLSHLQQMFNPLQKSRRQTLYVQSTDTEPKPKMKRRSEQLNCDVQPSQSFIETLDEEKRQQSKRKRLSKSFCGAPEDSNTTMEVTSKKPKKINDAIKISSPDGTKTETALHIEIDKEKVVSSTSAVVNKEELVTEDANPKKQAHAPLKDTDYYMEYCEEILQAANKAKLEQKKQQIAAGKITKSVQNPVGATTKSEQPDQPPNAKKGVKRLQAARNAVKHAMHLLAPDTASKELQTLARKLSPQPDVASKTKKVKKQIVRKRSKVNKPSPMKSSDEENHHAIKRIKTSAGYVLMSKDVKDRVELIKTRSGIVKVEPCTPTQKYFKELPPTPDSRSGFQERLEAGARSTVSRNPATESALRFKRQMFNRK
ncbi:protein slender lobes isoform X3 [Drosophila sulfurigaster albostrigata]|uniref:protein slender lobes isoform X3 n=1 Tax=Drosophila sulfurigaster albostrigata TaxID=89887 RepID=UPI002D219CDC|nr:protein slender lobes isoform X3 [Drosophila sulfurigaster albostrigata]